ncbi:hypothetical protein JRO89_XS15G0038400 [Xanthoceras sorbifolium]|uniref:HORMA domain-containing protein n=1 Tax=Xanthoceras sorbifolium TaxID=99658 RepID=A0ABQ8H0Z0_9ROSI|nr:hypothetical protein JRO89_XS15G0038400 [Xanthoceras sorbifolium]
MDPSDAQSPQGGTARILVEFLEVAITSIVFYKGVYAAGAFERRRYMNVVVQRARNPQLRDYIHYAVNGLLPFIPKVLMIRTYITYLSCPDPKVGNYRSWVDNYGLVELAPLQNFYFLEVLKSLSGKVEWIWSIELCFGLVERVAVIFFNTDNIPVEKYIFKLNINRSYSSNVEEGSLEFTLRSFLIKLSASQSLSRVLPRDCRWEITAYFRSLPQISTGKNADLWIPTDTKQWQQPPLITPIKSMSSNPLCVQLYLEHPSLSEATPQE